MRAFLTVLCSLVFCPLVFSPVVLCGCISMPDYELSSREVKVFDGDDPIPDDFVQIGTVNAQEIFEDLRPNEATVIKKLQWRAFQKGADAIGNIQIRRSSRDLYAQTPRHIELTAVANTYMQRRN